jgi:TonB family protein
MSEEKHIPNFTAADIEKYWNGRLTPSEMHTMEKAAMDDPFLADALEGYKTTMTPATDLDALRKKLDQRVSADTKVIPLKPGFKWLRVAAAIVIIAGGGLLILQLVFREQDQSSIADVKKTAESRSQADTNATIINNDAPARATSQAADTLTTSDHQKILNKPTGKTANGAITTDTTKDLNNLPAPLNNQAAVERALSPDASVVSQAQKKDESLKPPVVTANYDSIRYADKDFTNAAREKKASVLFERDRSAGIDLANKYNYRVVDAQNKPVPFANVMNISDKVGTYTDINGRFNLVSSDSILNVQIKSLGYVSDNYKLSPLNAQTGDLILKEDENAKKQKLAQNRKVVNSLSKKDSTEIEEPEVGWGFYNTYVANNIKIPDDVRKQNNNKDVELSFDINNAGRPVNIKVTKSSGCKACDDEAIRLLKEGPKWKKKGKRSKTTISIAVDQK